MWVIVYIGNKIWSAGYFEEWLIEELKNMGYKIRPVSKKKAEKVLEEMERGRPNSKFYGYKYPKSRKERSQNMVLKGFVYEF